MNAEYQRLETAASQTLREIEDLRTQVQTVDAMSLAALEERLATLGRQLVSQHLGMSLLRTVASAKMRMAEARFVANLPKKFHSQGLRKYVVQLPGEVSVTLEVRYYHRLKGAPAAKCGRRGLYPMLLLLGIVGHFTPETRKRMVKAATLLGSYEEATEMLAEQGIVVSVNVLRAVTAGVGEMLGRLSQAGTMKFSGSVTGRRIVVTTDGGRVRLRERRKGITKKKRKRFSARWREPRLFMIYAVDDQGRLAKDFPPIIDGLMGSCDKLFALLLTYLQALNITEAARVLCIADGATWIWNRVPKLIKRLGLQEGQVQQLLDFWHAVEYLGKLADSVGLTGRQRSLWLRTQKKRLKRGEIGAVIRANQELVNDRPSKNQKTWLNYFENHGVTHRRMDYARSPSNPMPIGSGAIESAVRRIINLRVKSNGVYWLRQNAESMIRLRAWIKAGRAQDLFQQTLSVTPLLAV